MNGRSLHTDEEHGGGAVLPNQPIINTLGSFRPEQANAPSCTCARQNRFLHHPKSDQTMQGKTGSTGVIGGNSCLTALLSQWLWMQ